MDDKLILCSVGLYRVDDSPHIEIGFPDIPKHGDIITIEGKVKYHSSISSECIEGENPFNLKGDEKLVVREVEYYYENGEYLMPFVYVDKQTMTFEEMVEAACKVDDVNRKEDVVNILNLVLSLNILSTSQYELLKRVLFAVNGRIRSNLS